MKTTTTVNSVLTSLLAASVLLLTGCSGNNQQAFSKRKYMPYFVKHHVKQERFSEPQTIGQEAVAARSVEEPVRDLRKLEVKGDHLREALAVEPFIETRQIPGPPAMQLRLDGTAEIPAQTQAETHASGSSVSGSRLEAEQPEFNRRKLVREMVRNDEEGAISLVLLVIIAVLLPPLAVLIVDGLSWSFLLSILLWLLFYIPGLIYALFVIFRAY